MELNKREIERLKLHLANGLNSSTKKLVPIVQSYTPIKEQRLHDSTRTEGTIANYRKATDAVLIGGVKRKGKFKEVGIEKLVNYAIYVEHRRHYILKSMPELKKALMQGMVEYR